MLELTREQALALAGEPHPVRMLDPATNTAYVLVRADIYDRVWSRFEGDEAGLDMRQVALLVERAMREEDTDDPTLAFYQQKYGKMPSSCM